MQNLDNQKLIIALSKENKEIKKTLKALEKKVELLSDKMQEFEIIFDAAEIIEEELDNRENKNRYNTEWNPYDDEDFHVEDYENYDQYDDDDDGDVPHGY